MRLFDKYRNNQTSEDEQSAMTEILIQNKFDEGLRQKMTQRLEQQYGIKRTPEASSARVRRLQLLRWGSSIAAAVLVGLAIWQVATPKLDYQALSAAYMTEYMATNERGKGLDNITEQRNSAIDAYMVKDFVLAAQLRETVTQSEQADAEDYLYLGLSYLYQTPPQTDKAITAFQSGLGYTDDKVREETQWYLSLSYLQAGQLQNARDLLETIVANKQWNRAKAKKLLKRIPQD